MQIISSILKENHEIYGSCVISLLLNFDRGISRSDLFLINNNKKIVKTWQIFKMGRKIPGKKHKGVKDPEKQREKRESEIKKKVSWQKILTPCDLAENWYIHLIRLIPLQKWLMIKRCLKNCWWSPNQKRKPKISPRKSCQKSPKRKMTTC